MLGARRLAKEKGQLRVKAPIPWLAWTSPDGRHGQTRNRANFCALWDRVVGDAVAGQGEGKGRVWVSSVLLPALPQGVVFEDVDGGNGYGYGDSDREHFFGGDGGEKLGSTALACTNGRWDAGPIVLIS
jgi:hypothetical protein